MKLKLDENLPETLLVELAVLNHDVDSVRQEGLAGHDDPDVWAAAQAEGRFLITQDLDFSDIRQFQPGTHHGLLLVRLPDAGRLALTRQIIEVFGNEDVESWAGCFAVLSGHKLRVLRPTDDVPDQGS
jgi:predicted nuclease of predicted toxin-antitoxin system